MRFGEAGRSRTEPRLRHPTTPTAMEPARSVANATLKARAGPTPVAPSPVGFAIALADPLVPTALLEPAPPSVAVLLAFVVPSAGLSVSAVPRSLGISLGDLNGSCGRSLERVASEPLPQPPVDDVITRAAHGFGLHLPQKPYGGWPGCRSRYCPGNGGYGRHQRRAFLRTRG